MAIQKKSVIGKTTSMKKALVARPVSPKAPQAEQIKTAFEYGAKRK